MGPAQQAPMQYTSAPEGTAPPQQQQQGHYPQPAAISQPYAQQSQPPPPYAPQHQPQHQQPVLVQYVRPGEWAYGLCSCLEDMNLCCNVCWCGVCQQAYLHDAVTESRSYSFNALVCGALTIGYLFVGGFACCAHAWFLRDKLRYDKHIEGNGCYDCCATCWCGPCVVCQAHREMKARGVDPGTCCCQSVTPLRPVPAQQPPVQHGFAAAPMPKQ